MSEKNKILLVDDEYDIALAFTLGLQSNGFLVDMFTSSIEALSSLKVNFYNLALLDIKMPEMDGLELAQKIRDKDEKIKICFLTAFDLNYPRVKEYSGCIIKKPISIDDLIKKIKMEIE